MTSIANNKETCFICGEVNEFPELLSTNTFGSYDLDFRPPEMERSALKYFVNRCPSCGYCAQSISDGSDSYKKVVESQVYQHQLNSSQYPELANSFLCCSMLAAIEENYIEAGLAALRAAWVCDDIQTNQANTCRKEATKFFELAMSKDKSISSSPKLKIIIVDLLRRCEEFEKSLEFTEETLSQNIEDLVRQALIYEEYLAKSRDAKCRTFAEAKKFFESNNKSPN